MKNVGLKFLLTGGQWFAAVLPEKDAVAYIERWRLGTGDKDFVFGGSKEKWAIKASQVVGMHLIDLEEQQRQQQAPPAQVPVYNPYGYNPQRS
jgi:hypothetical protein